MPRRVRSSYDLPVQADINVTSMVDVAFTLLVIFIITATVPVGGIQVNLPEGEAAPLQPDQEVVYLTIDAEGTIYIEDAAMASLDEFRTTFERLQSAQGWERVMVSIDQEVRAGVLMPVLAFVKSLGIVPMVPLEFSGSGN